MPNTELASLAADVISDQLREQLEDSEIIPRREYDTNVAYRDGNTFVVEFIKLYEDARLRSQGDVVLRIRVEAI